MGNLTDALARTSAKRLRPCQIADTLDVLGTDDADVLRDALDSRRYSHAHLSRALESEGYAVSSYLVRKHREGLCGCGT